MNQVATQEAAPERSKGTAVELYTAQVLGDNRRADLLRGLPRHIPVARFERNLVNLLMQNPKMMQYPAPYVFREVSKAAALGLLLDPHLGEAYIVPVWNGATKREEPQLRVGYRGIMKLGRQSGEIANLYPGEVCEFDFFDADEGTDKRLVHKPDYTKGRGNPVCYYAVVVYKDGTKDFDVMDIPQIHKIRDKSEGWKAFQAGRIKSTPWSSDEGEMCKKTVLKRLCKRVPQSPDLADAIAADDIEEEAYHNTIELQAQPQPRPEAKSIADRLNDFAEVDSDAEPVDPETGEVIDNPETPEPAAPPSAAAASAPIEASPPKADDGADALKLAEAKQRGREAFGSGYKREVPKPYQYKNRAAEAEAFLAGWDEEAAEIKAAESGTV
jgi:recombination protein RecT